MIRITGATDKTAFRQSRRILPILPFTQSRQNCSYRNNSSAWCEPLEPLHSLPRCTSFPICREQPDCRCGCLARGGVRRILAVAWQESLATPSRGSQHLRPGDCRDVDFPQWFMFLPQIASPTVLKRGVAKNSSRPLAQFPHLQAPLLVNRYSFFQSTSPRPFSPSHFSHSFHPSPHPASRSDI